MTENKYRDYSNWWVAGMGILGSSNPQIPHLHHNNNFFYGGAGEEGETNSALKLGRPLDCLRYGGREEGNVSSRFFAWRPPRWSVIIASP